MTKYRVYEYEDGKYVGQRYTWSGDLSDNDGMYWVTITDSYTNPDEAEYYLRRNIEKAKFVPKIIKEFEL